MRRLLFSTHKLYKNHMASAQSTQNAAWLRPSLIRIILLVLLGLLALGSVLQGAHNALEPNRSQDFQWSGERVLLDHLDPWAEYLRGDPNHRFILTQFPNYLPVLYVLISPIGLLSLAHAKFVWMLANVFFAVASALLAARFYGLRGYRTFVLLCLFLIATNTRNTIGNGQQGLLVLFVWCLSLLAPTLTNPRSILAGVSYFKFNFAPATFFYLLLRGGFRSVLLSAVPSAIATLCLWLWLHGTHDPKLLVRLVTEPFTVSQRAFFPPDAGANLMDILEPILLRLHVPRSIEGVLTIATASLVCFLVLYVAMRRRPGGSVQWHLALMATMSFCLFRHHDYDGIVLLLPFTYALRLWKDSKAQASLALIGFFWYFQRVLDAAHIQLHYEFVLQWVLLMLSLLLTFRLRTFEDQVAAEALSASNLDRSKQYGYPLERTGT